MNVKPKERTEFVGLRCTPEQKEQLKALAAAAGLSISGFILGECLGDKIGQMIIDGFNRSKN